VNRHIKYFPSNWDGVCNNNSLENNIDIVADNAPSTASSQRYDFAMLPSQTPCAPHERAPNNPLPLLTTSTRHQNPYCLQLFPIALMSQLTLTCGTATSQPHHYLALTNSCKITFAIWLACYNVWHAFSNSEV